VVLFHADADGNEARNYQEAFRPVRKPARRIGRPRFRAGVVFKPDPTDTHLEAKPYVKIGFFRTKSAPTSKMPTGHQMEVKIAGKVDKAHKALLERTGTRYEVKFRGSGADQRVESFASQAEAEDRANQVGGFVHDHYEGRDIYWSPRHLKRWRPPGRNDVPETGRPDAGPLEAGEQVGA